MAGINPLSAISSVTTGVSSAAGLLSGVTSIANLLLATPQVVGYSAQNTDASLQAPLLFHYEAEQTFSLESDITDYFAEDNKSLQDHIALQPELVTTQGFIGELTDIPATQILAIAKVAANKLTNIAGYLPALSATALIAYNEASFAYSTVSNAISTVSDTLNSLGIGALGAKSQNAQQVFFQKIYLYWQTRTLFTIQTPWQVMSDMAIKSVRAIQDQETQVVSSFEVTFKKMRFASSQVLNQQQATNRLVQALLARVNAGSAAVTPSSTTPSDLFSRMA